MSLISTLRSLVLASLALAGQALAAEPLQLEVYNPGHDAIFPVSSVIVSGKHDAIPVDAQFGKAQAEQLVQRLKAGGKRLITIYVSHGDPDYYFGLDTLTRAFPQARVVASAATVEHIRKTMDAKLDYWGPQMGSDRPAKLVVPQVLVGIAWRWKGRRWKSSVSMGYSQTVVSCGFPRSRLWSVAWSWPSTFMSGWPTPRPPSPMPIGLPPSSASSGSLRAQ